MLDKPDPKILRQNSSIYLDDVTIAGRTTDTTWADSLYAIVRMTMAGLPIGIGRY